MGDHSPSTLGLGRFAVGDQEGFVKVNVNVNVALRRSEPRRLGRSYGVLQD